jgi:hypothetical protein
MKKHLMLMTAMLSFGITHNCESSDKIKNNGEACKDAGECKSNVCTDEKCALGIKMAGDAVFFTEECASKKVSCTPSKVYSKEEIEKLGGGGAICEKGMSDDSLTIEKVAELRAGNGQPGLLTCKD